MSLPRSSAQDPLPDLPSESDVESQVSLPSVDDIVSSGSEMAEDTSWKCKCRVPCVKPGSDLLTHCKVTRELMQKLPRDQHRKRVWLMLRDLRVTKQVERGYQLLDTPVCLKIFQKACSVGHDTVKQLVKTVHLDGPPPDSRKRGLHCHANLAQMSPEQQDCEKFFFHCWSNYAMHIPTETGEDLQNAAEETPQKVEIENDLVAEIEDSQKTLVLNDFHADAAPSAALKVDGRRYLPHQTWQEFYELYVNWSEKPCHRTSFKRHYQKTEWKNKLRIADSQQHGKCTTCEKLKMLRQKAVCETQLKQIQDAHSNHVRSVMLDRQCDSLAEQLGRDSTQVTKTGCPNLVRERALLNWTQDAMDQSKFRCPRKTTMAKSLADAWRPQIGCHGLIFDGIGKMIFLADHDLGKDSDVQCTITARALEADFC